MSEPTAGTTTPAGDEPDDDDLRALLARRAQSKPNRTTWVLLVLIAVAIGFVLGACSQRVMGSISDSAPAPAAPASSGGADSAPPGPPPPAP
jgi:hypothetical protein